MQPLDLIEKARSLRDQNFVLFPADDAGHKVRILAVRGSEELFLSCDLNDCYRFCQNVGCKNIHEYLGVVK
jgi:hypothetical protein